MKMKKTLLTVASIVVLAAILLTGCQNPSETSALKEGSITLAVNPEIRVNYDEDALVTSIEGLNVDGESIVSLYPDFVGKECDVVLADLAALIKDQGYFIEDIDGNKKNVVIKLEEGSYIPNGEFLSDLETAVRSKVDEGNNIVTIDSDDYDERYENKSYISYDKAKEIALAQAHISGDDITFVEKEFDFDDGLAIYELEFSQAGINYEYDIDALTGKVISAHNSNSVQNDDTDYGPLNDGVTDYHDSDYGPNSDGITDYGNTDYGPNNDGVTDYDDTDYGPLNDGVTNYDDTDYGPNNDGVTNYDDTDYGPNADGVTDYSPAPTPDTTPAPSNNTNYSNYGNSSNYDASSNYDDGNSDYD